MSDDAIRSPFDAGQLSTVCGDLVRAREYLNPLLDGPPRPLAKLLTGKIEGEVRFMSGKWIFAVFVLSFGLSAKAFEPMANCRHSSKSFHCVEYTKNYDGDTFTVNIPLVHPLIGSKITVRVDGIDSPEMDGDGACERQLAYRAQQEAERILSNARRIDLVDIKRDKYFRVLATVEADGRNLGDHLIRMGLAVPYDGGIKAPTNWCRR